ncbi:hypothetical protein [Halonotius terrestris]|uniref:hypothetical protein n=1 Tax=Halonotius terrestris TaxID=2487750 RepID=UPI00163CE42D|nr:hypothetical protein [Halonotius terrestris]
MDFEWVYPVACPACTVCPQRVTDYDELGYPICPQCGTTIRSAAGGTGERVAAARTE